MKEEVERVPEQKYSADNMHLVAMIRTKVLNAGRSGS